MEQKLGAPVVHIERLQANAGSILAGNLCADQELVKLRIDDVDHAMQGLLPLSGTDGILGMHCDFGIDPVVPADGDQRSRPVEPGSI